MGNEDACEETMGNRKGATAKQLYGWLRSLYVLRALYKKVNLPPFSHFEDRADGILGVILMGSV